MSSRKTPFQIKHELEFGLKVSQRDPGTKLVLSVRCQFCVHFGKEEKVGSKRKAAQTTKEFGPPFRQENYRSHLNSQHPIRWAEYCKLPNDGDRVAFFGTAKRAEKIMVLPT
jgi:hypothetical protein